EPLKMAELLYHKRKTGGMHWTEEATVLTDDTQIERFSAVFNWSWKSPFHSENTIFSSPITLISLMPLMLSDKILWTFDSADTSCSDTFSETFVLATSKFKTVMPISSTGERIRTE